MTKIFPVDIFAFASTRYWITRSELEARFDDLKNSISASIPAELANAFVFHLLRSEEEIDRIDPAESPGLAAFLPMSGGVQPWMMKLAERYNFIALLNAYLPEFNLPRELSETLLAANAHPACADFYSRLNLRNRWITWVSSLDEEPGHSQR